MNAIYLLIPVTLVLLGIAIVAYLWAVRSGQFDDLDQEASRILFDEEPRPGDIDDTKSNQDRGQ